MPVRLSSRFLKYEVGNGFRYLQGMSLQVGRERVKISRHPGWAEALRRINIPADKETGYNGVASTQKKQCSKACDDFGEAEVNG